MKKKNIFRRAAAAAVAVLTLAAAGGCGSEIKPAEPSEEDIRVVGTMNGTDIYYEELRYVVLNTKDDMKLIYGDSVWDSDESAAEHLPELRDRVKKGIQNDYHAVAAMADFYYPGKSGVMFTEKAITEAVRESINELAKECGGKKEYLASLEENYLTDHLIRYYYTAETCATELVHVLSSDLGEIASTDTEVLDFMHTDGFARTNHVFLKGITEENEKTAEKIREALLGSTDLEYEIWLQKTTNRDADTNITTTHGAYFAAGTSDYGDAYEKEAFALKPGEVSEVVRSISPEFEGYFVIVRLPVEDDWIKANFEEMAPDVILSQFNVILREYQDKLDFQFNEYGSSIDLLQIK